MAHTYGSCLYHIVFATSERRFLIAEDWQPKLWEYMGGIARANSFKSLITGGTANHVHQLLNLPPTMAPSKAVQLIKGGSSKWLNDTFLPETREFAWQAGYGVFSIGFSQVSATVHYIEDQPRHHGARSFEEEYRLFLEKHMIAVNEDYWLD